MFSSDMLFQRIFNLPIWNLHFLVSQWRFQFTNLKCWFQFNQLMVISVYRFWKKFQFTVHNFISIYHFGTVISIYPFGMLISIYRLGMVISIYRFGITISISHFEIQVSLFHIPPGTVISIYLNGISIYLFGMQISIYLFGMQIPMCCLVNSGIKIETW